MTSFSRYIYCFIILLSVIVISEYHLGRLNIGIDQLKQYAAAKSLISGNGLNSHTINYTDLSEPNQEIFTSFPPGFSILVSPLFLLTDDIRIINLILTALNLLIFLYGSFMLVRILTNRRITLKILATILLFLSINAAFVILASSSDLICLNLFILAAIALIKSNNAAKPAKYIAFACACMVLTVYFRYAYLPALLVIPLYFLLRILIFKTEEGRKLRSSVISTILFSIPIISQIAYINLQTEYVQSKASNIMTLHWENLISVSPFPLHGFFDLYPFLRAIGYSSEFGYDRGYSYPYILDIAFYIASILILIPALKYLSQFINKKSINSPVSNFGLFGITLSLCLLGLIYFGSLINPSQMEEYNWSWVKIFRYVILPVYLIQITYFLIIVHVNSRLSKKFAIVLVSLSFVYALSLKSYNYTVNYNFFDFSHNITLLIPNNAALNSYEIHKILPSDQQSIALVDKSVFNALYNPVYFLSLNNCTTGIIDSSFNTKLSTSEPIDIYIITDQNQTNTSHLIQSYNAEQVEVIGNDIRIFKFRLNPNS